jgi:hypothetical protein
LVWLTNSSPTETTEALALRLVLARRTNRTDAVRRETDRLLALQHDDGGWSQLHGLCSDAFATGQVLFALNVAELKRDRPEIRRAVAFLIANQRSDGSWPMVPRGQPGVKPASLITPIVHLGSAWGVIGLARSVER